MRAMFYGVKGAGHVNPTVPLVRGLVERGHDVTYTLTSEWRDRLEALGCRYRNMGEQEAFTTADFNPGAPFFRQLIPAAVGLLPRLLEEARAARPDVIVFDSCAPWGYAISEILGVPGICSVSTLVFDRDDVRQHWGAPSERTDAVHAAAISELARRWGIDLSDRDIGMFYGHENLVYSCPELNPTRTTLPWTFHLVGPTLSPGGELGDLDRYRRGRRRIYVSTGSVIGGTKALERSFYAPFLEAFGDRDGYELLMSVGAAADSFENLPPNVTVRRSVPQVAVLAHTDVFVSHMGANSMHESLFHGVPLVCVPHWGDMLQNSARVAAQGAGVVVPLADLSAARLAAAVEQASSEAMRANATRLANSLQACGGLDRALGIIEDAARSASTSASARRA